MEKRDMRYSRQYLFAKIGKQGQEKLKQSKVAIVGMGALGSALANHMVRSGIGYVRIIDRDVVEYSNLQRQILYDEADAEQRLPKVIAAKTKLNQINSEVTVDAHIAELIWQNAETLLNGVDLILDGTDNFEVRYLINDVAVKNNIPWIYGGAISSRGMTATIIPNKTPCFSCLFPKPPETEETCDAVGVISPIIQIVTGYQATEALKLLLGDYEHLNLTLRNFDLWQNEDFQINLKNGKNENCPTCVKHKYDYLEPLNKINRITVLCGDSVQINLVKKYQIDIKKLKGRLEHFGKVEETPYLLRFYIEGYNLTIYQDGRILIHGTSDKEVALKLYHKYIFANFNR